MTVTGVGGYFFRAEDPEALKAWYRDHLGVGGGIGTNSQGQSNNYCWYYEAGPMVFAPFDAKTDYFPADRSAMINLRVRGLRELLDRLTSHGISIESEDWDTEAGSFARIKDPEGNPVELWEPPARSL